MTLPEYAMRADESPKNWLISILASIIHDAIASRERSVIFTLGQDSQMFRPDPRRGSITDPIALKELLAYAKRSWRPMGGLRSLLHEYAADLLLVRDERSERADVLSFLACRARHWAQLLAKQLGAGDEITAPKTQSGVRKAYLKFLDNSQQIHLAMGAAVRGIVCSIAPSPEAINVLAKPAMVRFALHEGQAWCFWLDANGKELAREPLDPWVERLRGSRRTDCHLRQLEKLRQQQRSLLAAGKDLLRHGCPELTEAVEHACSHRQLAGYTVCPRVSVNGLPAQVSLYFEPGPTPLGPAVLLVARHAREEFILQSSAGVLFYFPPIQVEAQISFCASREMWHIPLPRVRMPKGGPAFTHPYTGRLEFDRLGAAEMFSLPSEDPMATISKAGRQLLPTSVERYTMPASADLCLTGHEHTVRQIGETVRGAENSGCDPDLATAVWSLWNIVSVGLTHGHTNNQAGPRIELTESEWFYTIRNPRRLVGTTLLECISPYDPARPVVLR